MEKPLQAAVGQSGVVELYSDVIKIEFRGLLAKLGGKQGKEIKLYQVHSVELEEPGWVTPGYINFILYGKSGNPVPGKGRSDEKCVEFASDQKDAFKALKAEVEARAHDSLVQKVEADVAATGSSNFGPALEKSKVRHEETQRLRKAREDENQRIKDLVSDSTLVFRVTHERGLQNVPPDARRLVLFLTKDKIVLTEPDKDDNSKVSGTTDRFFLRIPYNRVIDVRPVEQEMGSVMRTLTGTQQDARLRETNFNLIFEDDDGAERIARLSMYEGWGDATKAKFVTQFIDQLQPFRNQFKKSAPMDSTEQDIITKLERLAQLKEKGIITDEEFQAKKAELLKLL